MSGFPRPVKVLDASGKKPFLVDSRTVETRGGWLTYLVNLKDEPADLKLETDLPVRRIANLTSGEPLAGREVRLERHGRAILRLER